ncbi:hypothetical protein AC629_33685 [Bradyrhizobium sp. NAS80.1]|uniref:helix-turn-helix domain-containing protein n=1 Tax=Bradyrhizobium sp. NAS80.1 TaxID=1680159 RepID=UPI000969D71A|nr:helix-turn-helix domain-containing protein [Bradyrhizobium sp. NAS80.1]OKO75715.1 hypothetical protein AC629_33685 [Bradyrhizobium sp. NAS80.1]
MSRSSHTSPAGQASGVSFTEDQFNWLRQVAADCAALPPLSGFVAIALTKYFNRKEGGWAWMAQTTLADDLGISVRTIGTVLSALVERGHLISKRRGREETNLYHLALKNSDGDRKELADHTGGVIGKSLQSDRQNRVKVIGKGLPTNPLNEPLEEPIEEIDSPQLDLGDQDSGRRSQSQNPDTNAAFEEWWKQYPKKVDKAAAKKAYLRVVQKKQATPAELLSGAMHYAAERSGHDPKFTKYLTTWLNAGS